MDGFIERPLEEEKNITEEHNDNNNEQIEEKQDFEEKGDDIASEPKYYSSNREENKEEKGIPNEIEPEYSAEIDEEIVVEGDDSYDREKRVLSFIKYRERILERNMCLRVEDLMEL